MKFIPKTFMGILAFCFTLWSLSLVHAQSTVLKGKKILVFSSTKGYRHGSIGAGKKFFLQLAQQKGFQADTTEDAGKFNEGNGFNLVRELHGRILQN